MRQFSLNHNSGEFHNNKAVAVVVMAGKLSWGKDLLMATFASIRSAQVFERFAAKVATNFPWVDFPSLPHLPILQSAKGLSYYTIPKAQWATISLLKNSLQQTPGLDLSTFRLQL